MRKSCKVLLIVAGVFIGIGAIFCAMGFAFGGGNFMSDINRSYNQMSATFDEVEVIDVFAGSSNVVIKESATKDTKITYSVSEDFSFDVNKTGKKLSVEFKDYRKWFEFIRFIGAGKCEVIIEVPDNTLDSLEVKTSSGSIEAKTLNSLVTKLTATSGSIEAGGTVGEMTISCSSGSIKVVEGTRGESLDAKGTSGSLWISGDFKKELKAKITSGRITLKDVSAEKTTLENTSGSINAENVKAATVDTASSSGSISFYDVISSGDMYVRSTSGSVKLDRVDAQNYELKSVSGSIRATILTPKIYDLRTTSGSTSAPFSDSDSKGLLTARATSGSIRIELAQ